jgi:uncharacterized membrane protein
MSSPDLEADKPSVLMPTGITLAYNMTGALILLLILIFHLVKNVWSYTSTPHTSLMLLHNDEMGKVLQTLYKECILLVIYAS